MLWLISPTKNMKTSSRKPESLPVFLKQSEQLINQLKKYTVNELMELMKINEKLAELNYQRYKIFAYDEKGTCAIDLYDGLQFKAMQSDTFNQEQIDYANEHLRILSGMYGILKPLDSTYPYRLEMQCALKVNAYKDLYAFWNKQLLEQLRKELIAHKTKVIVDLTSKEYTKSIYPYLSENDSYISISFKINKEGKLKTQATDAKMARGAMIKEVVKQRIDTLEEIKQMRINDYVFDENLSNDKEYVYVKYIK